MSINVNLMCLVINTIYSSLQDIHAALAAMKVLSLTAYFIISIFL